MSHIFYALQRSESEREGTGSSFSVATELLQHAEEKARRSGATSKPFGKAETGDYLLPEVEEELHARRAVFRRDHERPAGRGDEVAPGDSGQRGHRQALAARAVEHRRATAVGLGRASARSKRSVALYGDPAVRLAPRSRTRAD